jgi:tetratricopeptide (TPR) repeat protein
MEDKSFLLQRLHELESQIQELSNQLAPQKKSKVNRYLTRPCKALLANWTLVAFLTGLLLAGWLYWRYDVTYFESEKSSWLKKKSADAYRQLGDRLMLYGEFEAAKDAYASALKINDINAEATRGLLITQVLQPLQGQKYLVPEITAARIQHLKGLFEREERVGLLGFLGRRKPKLENEQGYMLDYFEGLLAEQKDDPDAAEFYRKAVRKRPDFVWGYLALALMDYERQDFDKVINTLLPVQEKNPDSAAVASYLGACYLVKGDFANASKQFQIANQISPSFVSRMDLAEAYRYSGHADQAIIEDEGALALVEQAKDEDDWILNGTIVSSFMPEDRGGKPPKFLQYYLALEHKRTLVLYSLSLDYALNGDFDRANQTFEEANKLDPKHVFNPFVLNRLTSLEHFSGLELKSVTLTWMHQAQMRLRQLP